MRGYKHNRLDGSTNRVMREVKINLFNKPQSPQFIFCLSTRSGRHRLANCSAEAVIDFGSFFYYISPYTGLVERALTYSPPIP
jgi:SNF2 family DNA or RNA helicase